MSSTGPERAVASPFRFEMLGTPYSSSIEREYVAPEVPVEELERFESLADDRSADTEAAEFEMLGTPYSSPTEREYVEPEVPAEELELFESLADDGLGREELATDIDRMDGETYIAGQEVLDRPMAADRRSDEDAGWGEGPDEEASWAAGVDEVAEVGLGDGSGEADDEAEPEEEATFEETNVDHIDEAHDEEEYEPTYLGLAEDEPGMTFAQRPVMEPDLTASNLAESELGYLAEKVASRGTPWTEGELPRRNTRWTRCFSTTDLTPVRQEYADNLAAAAGNPGDRASCIVMLNVALGRLLSLRRKSWPARGNSARRVRMADLITHSIGRALGRLVTVGYARGPLRIDFLDSRGRRAGTTKPERLRSSVLTAVLARSPQKGCYYAFALSIMDDYHSVLLVVDRTGSRPLVEWFDQFSPRGIDDVTTTLDDRITDMTKQCWQGVKDTQHIGSKTPVRIWALRKPIKAR
ncbi:hypothetical protein ACQEVF_56990 [Nonomuraea polychroma]|uniref:hypothetical protein n=1 Tax=Nonomuraea polychroma TaxID=46176 RepID=UPI003D8D2CA3